jgi:tetrahydromethanopterin S-methyltransferase subunit B
MNENVENLILAQLREIRTRLDSVDHRLDQLSRKVDEGFDSQSASISGVSMILTLLAHHVHGIEERVEKLERVLP